MSDFCMPSLGADMERGRIVEWRVQPGEAVRRGQVVLLVETDKGVIEVEIWQDAVVEELLVPGGEDVPVGTPIARLRESASAPPPVPQAPAPFREAPAPIQPVPAPVGSPPADSARLKASPLARRLAAERGLALGTVRGSGPGGAIVARDLGPGAAPVATTAPATPAETVRAEHAEAAAPRAPAAPPADETPPMRRAIARAMSLSKREIPHYYLATQICLERAMTWLREENEGRPLEARLLPAVLLLKAAARAVAAVPEVNGYYRDGRFEPASAVHLGVAISLREGGLVIPAIHHASTLSLGELMDALTDVSERARSGRLRSSELTDGTITVTSLGQRGVEWVQGVIYPPQVALVGFGKVVERPWAEGGLIGVRPLVGTTLAADHRVSDGHRGAMYLAAIDQLLQHPEEL
ncbi:MAG: 2-oxo acid dehydrogenase subunit E2 [Deltaproteobacteria bacterium]|nr:2-oxo acid dehydrogenase subunit E2 [Deltaproteobacteria bacterium]